MDDKKVTHLTYFWDIETSRITTDCNYEMQITYLSNVVCMDCNTGEILSSLFFRTIEETIDHFLKLPNCIVWSHNLDYELTFLLREMQPNGLKGDYNDMYDKEEQEIILRDKNAPLSITLEEIPNVTFRDSYALFNKSVGELGDDIELPKLDYDYKVIRTPWCELTEHDYNYNERDNIIVAISIYNYMVTNKVGVNEIPLTFTSSVRKKRKEFITSNYGAKTINKYYYDRLNSFRSFDIMEDLMKVYQGGLTTSSMIHTSCLISNEETSGVLGVDIKSSYPNQMCTEKFPKFEEDNTCCGQLAEMTFKSGLYKGFIGLFRFENIRVKNENYLLPISSSQVRKGEISDDASFFNGKLLNASYVTLPCNDVDVEVIDMVYDYDNIICERITTATKEQYLRKEEVAFILHNFLIKETKSGIEKDIAKLIINSMYGVKVSCPIKDYYEIVDGEVLATDFFSYNNEDREEIYNNFIDTQTTFGGSIDVYSHGVYITSYARRQLVKMMTFIVDNGGKVVYSDTDSIKFYCDTVKDQKDLLEKIISMNEEKQNKNKKLPRYKSFKNDFDLSDEEYEIISTLGIWEIEDKKPHKLFMTYGAKKYGYVTSEEYSSDNKKLKEYLREVGDDTLYNEGDIVPIIKTTIAGCNKKNIPKVIRNVALKNEISIEESFAFVFSPGTTFDESASGRTTAKKENMNILDMQNMKYKGQPIKQYGGIVIKDTTYTLNMTLKDSKIVGYNETDLMVTKINIEGDVSFE